MRSVLFVIIEVGCLAQEAVGVDLSWHKVYENYEESLTSRPGIFSGLDPSRD